MGRTPRMEARHFDQLATQYGRWTARSLGVVRALLVDGKKLADAAAAVGMKPQQANTLRWRFLHLAETKRAEAFMAQHAPAAHAIDPYASNLKLLHVRGYSVAQMQDFLKGEGVKVTVKELRRYLKENLG